MEIDLKQIQRWIVPGLYALIDPSSKQVDVRYSNNVMKSLVTCLSQPDPYLKPSLDHLEFQFLEECSDPSLQKIRQGYFVKEFEKLSYSPFVKKKIVTLRVKIEDIQVRNRLYFAVYVKYTNNKKVLVGLFENKFLADEFFEQYYCNFDGSSVTYCTNELTSWYYKQLLENPWVIPFSLL